MNTAGGIAVTVRRDRRSPNVWAVVAPPPPGARRIGSVKPAHDSTCRAAGGMPAAG